ncbi:MAG: DMT family transporter [Clostridia bacterium]|nr:DMT family transporter [Clostridia bacterium]
MFYILLALFSGCLVILSMVFNSQLAKRIGVFRGTLVNYAAGLLTTLAVIGILQFPILTYTKSLGRIPFWAFCGGLLGVAVVAASNVIIPKVATVYVTLLTFTGQLLAGIIIDLIASGAVSPGKVIGVILMIAGLAYNSYVDAINAKNELLQE